MSRPTYKAAVLKTPGTIEIEEREIPDLAPHEALVKVRYAGICGTDLAIYRGSYQVPLPLVLGHEFSGEVISVGDARVSGWIGKRVTAEINSTCSATNTNLCAACRNDLPSHCLTRTVLGIASQDGVFAEYTRVPILCLHAIPDSIPMHHGPFIEPLAAAIQTFELTPINTGDVIVVMGTGRLGVLVCKVASLKGARVIAVSRNPYKLQLARKFGAHVLIDAEQQDVRDEVMKLTEGLGAHIVVESTGTPSGLNSSLELVRPRGTVCLKSTPGTDYSDLPLTKAVVDEIRIQGSRCEPFGKAIRMMSRYHLEIDALISQTFPLNEMEAAMDAASRKFKVIIEAA